MCSLHALFVEFPEVAVCLSAVLNARLQGPLTQTSKLDL